MTKGKSVIKGKLTPKRKHLSNIALPKGAKPVPSNTERIRELESLVEVISRGRNMWQTTFDAIRDPVVIVSDKYLIERANTQTANISGEHITKLVGQTCYSAFAGRKDVCPGCPLSKTFEAKAPNVAALSEPIRAHDFKAHAYPYASASDGKKLCVMYYRDITEENRLARELIQNEKMAAIGMLAGGVAHEINNPLGGILAFTQLIIRDIPEGTPMRADLGEIENAAKRCKKIVQDLLDFSRLSSGKEKKWVTLPPLVEGVVPFIKRELKSLNIELLVNVAPELPQIWGDANRLQQVFLNLFTNACHAMTKGGKLVIDMAFDISAPAVVIEVSDTGHGIPKEAMSKIFDPFFTTKEPGKGTGLGLSISYRIIKDHGGIIDVASEVNSGTKFTIKLPTVKEGSERGGS